MVIPEFILRKLYVQDSLQAGADGLSFALNNTFAPATVTGFRLEVDGQPVPPGHLTIQASSGASLPTSAITADNPFALPVGVQITVRAQGAAVTGGHLTVHANTKEMGLLTFSIQAKDKAGLRPSSPAAGRGRPPLRFLQRPLRAEIQVDAGAVIGEINPYVYGQFVEHLERCVYGGLWTDDGSRLRDDTLALVQDLKPPLIRYPGGNFASGYHWEDGIGPKTARPRRHDAAWNAWESNQVGTDEFLALCAQIGADPFLVVNDGSGTAEEATRWVAYCNEPPSGEQGRRRAANGHPEPYGVRLWGVGNEVWGRWQIGHTGPAGYAARLRQFAEAMRQVDPSIQIVAVGDGILDDTPDNPGRRWNETVLREAGDQIDHLSFHIYQPEKEGWQESYDPAALHQAVCAAPLDVEAIVGRLAAQIAALTPSRAIHVALDEWNLWLPPPPGAGSMHQVVYTLRDALYVAGMLNVFHRQCRALAIANLAQLVNVLPLIVTDQRRAIATTLYYPFLLYRHMERLALQVKTAVATFDSPPCGTIGAHQTVPYLDVTATCDADRRRLVLGLVNRHQTRSVKATVALSDFRPLKPDHAWLLAGPDPLAANTLDHPDRVRVETGALPVTRRGRDDLEYNLPACSVAVLVLSI
jgi:alpha-N-arabinofuranosidase